MPVPQSLFSPKQVAEALQVSESSVKRWCDQGLIPMSKTAGGHRRIALDELLRFVTESERPLLNPMAIGLTAPPTRMRPVTDVPGSEEQKAFRGALSAGDEQRCREVMDQVFLRTGSVTRACELLITDAMHRFGEAWERDELDVYQERRGCEICLRLVHHLRQQAPAPTGPVAIGGSMEGDLYQLPTALVELALREAGWRAESLGVNLPFPSLEKAIADYRPRLCWISVSSVGNEETFAERFNALADRLPQDCILLVGGRALHDRLRPRLRYTAHCDNVQQLVGLAEILKAKTQASSDGISLKQSDN